MAAPLIGTAIGSIIFGTGYGLFTRVGHEAIGDSLGSAFGFRTHNKSHKYYGAPSNFKLPYYRQSRYGRSRYGRRSYGRRYSRYSRFGSRRIFRRYRSRRFY